MSARSDYLLKVLQTIGGPLMASMSAAVPDDETDVNTAQRMAELLNASVKLSIDISQATQFDTPAKDEHDDSTRAALTGIASRAVAAHFTAHGKAPTDEDVKKISAGLSAVLSFSENFNEENGATEKLENINAQNKKTHENLQYVHAWIPVLNAVAQFSFGQTPFKLAADIGNKIVARRDALFATTELKDNMGDDAEHAKRALLQTLTEIYAACHAREVERLNNSESDDTPSLDPVWKDFDTRIAMLEALSNGFMGKPMVAPLPTAPGAEPIVANATHKTSNAVESLKQSVESAKEHPTPEATSAETQAPEQQVQAQEPSKEEDTKPAAPPAGGPMGFFAAPKKEEPAPPAPETPTPATPDAQDTSASIPTPTDAPPAENKSDESASSSGGGGPMSFFKAPPKDED